ncbi:hypothetical protein [Xenorhabdus bovienii]|uniref:hypothetical protein n=1 Tax=Xenorhabdus bovienii TaxID=40576 RepID=UPI0023B3030F|nr:hypothetical protein [Xenorhabdus bovienii]MDE9433600.1 hypothetical protein [Xenorhabdus bovienii]MDE9489890.1 hypothetical protein [Xenorhabdus bovienii]MDE9506401.1 hypothetical protein [Xenorhabdus bovienii]
MMDSPEKILYKEYGSQGGEDHLINSRSLQGRARLRYICALLEADIVRQQPSVRR